MKKLKKLNKFLLLLILPFLCVSCLVDDDVNGNLQDIEKSPVIVGFESSNTLESHFEDVGVIDVDILVEVLGGNEGNGVISNTEISFTIDPLSTATEGNEYSLTGNSLIIPAGTTFGTLPIKINTGSLDLEQPTELILKLTTTDNSSIVSAIDNTYIITFVGCQSSHTGTYTNPDLPSGAGGLATITQTLPNTFSVSALPFLGTGGGINPIPFTFTNVCSEINITNWALSGSNLIIGTGEVDENTGALTFKYIVYNGTSISDGIFFDFSSDSDASTYTLQ